MLVQVGISASIEEAVEIELKVLNIKIVKNINT
jgi:hypothetical protein